MSIQDSNGQGQVFRYGGDFADRRIVRAEGSYIYDAEGRKILDFTSGQMSGILGHGHPEIVAVVRETIARLDHLHSGFLSDPVTGFAEALTAMLPNALDRICAQAEQAARDGKRVILLSDRNISPDSLPVHALLATGAVHDRLVRTGLRCNCNIIVETGTARDPHHFACLIGYGATAVYPYLAYHILFDMTRTGEIKADYGKRQRRECSPNTLDQRRTGRSALRRYVIRRQLLLPWCPQRNLDGHNKSRRLSRRRA